MITLVEVELRRLLARRLARGIAAAVLVGVVIAPPIVSWTFRERARIERDADLERCVLAQPPKVRDGAAVPTIPSEIADPREREQRCEAAIPRRTGSFHLDDVEDVLRPLGAVLIMVGFALGASAVGADWQARFLPTLLTWEGRRSRVFAAKAAAAAGTVGVGALAVQSLLVVSLWLLALASGTVDDAGTDWLGTTAGLEARVAMLAAGAAALGHALALVGRGTAAALGAGLAYVLALESVLGTNVKSLRPWLVLDNAIVFVRGEFEGGPGGDVPGRTVSAAGVILACYLLAGLVVSLGVFQRRDVT